MNKTFFARWRASFLTGLAIVFPVVITFGICKWLFGTVSNVTDTLLFFLKYILDEEWIYQNGQSGPMFWYWSVTALLLAVGIITLVGRMARNLIGKQIIAVVDRAMLRLPLLNKIYGAIKQVNEAFTSDKKTAFKTVVLVEFPRKGVYSVGFVTSEQNNETQSKTPEKVVSVFVPTTPNPTSGWLVLVPEKELTIMQMEVADAIKFIISLGSISPPSIASFGSPQAAIAAAKESTSTPPSSAL